jgi:hypothetical protein
MRRALRGPDGLRCTAAPSRRGGPGHARPLRFENRMSHTDPPTAKRLRHPALLPNDVPSRKVGPCEPSRRWISVSDKNAS